MFFDPCGKQTKLNIFKPLTSFYQKDLEQNLGLKEMRRLFHDQCPIWVNFTNVLRSAFMLADPESAKNLLNLTVFLRFWCLRA